jgi:hypothetical protein
MAKSVQGQVAGVSAHDDDSFIVLDIPEAEAPRGGIFRLRRTAANYNAMYSLALVAAANRLPIGIKTVGDISPQESAVVDFVRIRWVPGSPFFD